MSVSGIVSIASRAAFVLAAVAVLAAAAVTLADVFMRHAFRAPLRGAYDLMGATIAIAVLLGAPAALYHYRDPAIPAGPRWAGRAGTAAALLVLAAFAALMLYILYAKFGFKDDRERSTIGNLPTTLIAVIPLYICFALLALTQIGLIAASVSGAPAEAPLPWALALGLATLLAWVALQGFGKAMETIAVALVSDAGALVEWALPVLAAGAIAGAIAALRPATGIAAVAAPLATVVLVSLNVQASIFIVSLALLLPALLLAILHGALGAWRGWRGMTDDLIGLGILCVSALLLASGLFTPSEFGGAFGLVMVGVLAILALVLRTQGGVVRPLVRGLANGIGALFALLMYALLANAATFTGFGDFAAMPEMFSGPLGFVIVLALGLGLAALFGSTIGCLLTAFLVATLAGKTIEPVLVVCVVALATMAGAAFHPWLARRLAGDALPNGTLGLRPAVLAALPPAAIAALIWFAPDVALLLPRAVIN